MRLMSPFKVCNLCGVSRGLKRYDEGEKSCRRCLRELNKPDPVREAVAKEFPRAGDKLLEFTRKIKEASFEGRLCPDLARVTGLPTGQYPCPVCGMRHWIAWGADICCSPALEAFEAANPGVVTKPKHDWHWS